MKVAIIGSEGFVGRTMAEVFGAEGIDVVRIDTQIEESMYAQYARLAGVSFTFICVSTPFDPVKNLYDYSNVDDVLYKLEKCDHHSCICLRSTVTPDFFARRSARHVRLHQPEFLTMRQALDDFLAPDIHIIGRSDSTPDEHVRTLIELYESCGIVPSCTLDCSLEEAALLKVTHNVYRALRISFLNELHVTVERMGGDWKRFQPQLSAMFAARGFGGDYLSVPGPDGQFGFGGACFPKDLAAFIGYLEANRLPHRIMDAVRDVNARMRLPR